MNQTGLAQLCAGHQPVLPPLYPVTRKRDSETILPSKIFFDHCTLPLSLAFRSKMPRLKVKTKVNTLHRLNCWWETLTATF